MKTRLKFVSNSSSSSFTCSVCGETESGMDASASDFDMLLCVNGHCFCRSHQEDMEVDYKKIRELIKNYIAKDEYADETSKEDQLEELKDIEDEDLIYSFDEYFEDGIPAETCPICSFKNIKVSDGFLFLKKETGNTDEDLLKEIKRRFKSYEDFSKYIKPKTFVGDDDHDPDHEWEQ